MKRIVGNQTKIKLLEKFAASPKPDGAYIISGPVGVGKKEAAEYFIRLLMGQKASKTGVYRIAPELVKKKEKNKSGQGKQTKFREKEITVGQIRGAINFMNLKSAASSFMVCIIEKAEKMTPEAQNALLKSLEEPKGGNIFLLVAEAEEKLLPTIRSRSALIKLGLSNPQTILKKLIREGKKETVAKAAAYYGWGKMESSRRLAENPEHFKLLEETRMFFLKLMEAPLFEKINLLETRGDSGKVVQEVDLWTTFLTVDLERKIIGESLVGENDKNGKPRLSFEETIALLNEFLSLRKKLKYANASPRLALEAAFL